MSLTRRGFLLAAASATIMGLETDDAEAKARKKRAKVPKTKPKEALQEAAKKEAPLPPPRMILFQSLDGDVVREQFSTLHRHPASLTKMMTLYCVMETMEKFPKQFNMKSKVTLTSDIQDPEFVRRKLVYSKSLKPGQVHDVKKLMIASGTASDAKATTAIAVHAGQYWRTAKDQSQLEAFVAHMNNTAKKLGMDDTQFRNPTGAPNERHYSTAADIAKLAKALYTRFPEGSHMTMGQAYVQIEPVSSKKKHTSPFVRENPKDTVFFKTGTTNAAGSCLAGIVDVKGRPYIGVIIGAANPRECASTMSAMINAAIKGERVLELPKNPPIPTWKPDIVPETQHLPKGILGKELPAELKTAKLGTGMLSPEPMGKLQNFGPLQWVSLKP